MPFCQAATKFVVVSCLTEITRDRWIANISDQLLETGRIRPGNGRSRARLSRPKAAMQPGIVRSLRAKSATTSSVPRYGSCARRLIAHGVKILAALSKRVCRAVLKLIDGGSCMI